MKAIQKKEATAYKAKLNTCGNDLSKQWYVSFSYKNPETGKYKRFKVYEGFTERKTVEARLQYGEQLIEKINLKLKNGWNPFYDEYTLYKLVEVAPVYESNLLVHHVNLALTSKKAEIRKKTYQSYNSHLRGFLAWITENRLDQMLVTDFTYEHAKLFIDSLYLEKGYKGKTRSCYLITMKMLFERIKETRVINENPFKKFKKIKYSSVSALYFDEFQRKELKEYLIEHDPQLGLFVQFIFYCFIRPGELRKLRVGDIHGNKIQIKGEISKNTKTEYVVIPGPLMNLLDLEQIRLYPKHYFIFGKTGKPSPHYNGINYFSRKHREILRLLNYDKSHCLYSWKHTGVIHANKIGKNIHDIKRQLRHHSLEMVDEYLKGLGLMESGFASTDYPEL
ncbi:site-specific integrase [Rhodocytophaga rosea]|uniref:Site-specific integrase n=1 Tax=Rhodocytophaga rosea TaxID=2704465 RepID=A0A6C0GCU6_9BACT|nr:site-specific integrase [Rhodocytophaga rosea]QHT65652.1 site-specific integrase [Rhodocytophaga rosea]